MNTPESSPSPEPGESKRNITVRIRNPDLIKKAAGKGFCGILGDIPLNYPFAVARVYLDTQKGRKGEVTYEISGGIFPRKEFEDFNEIKNVVITSPNSDKTALNLYTTEDGYDFILGSRDPKFPWVHIGMTQVAIMNERGEPKKRPHDEPLNVNEKDFDKRLSAFAKLFERILNEVYEVNGTLPPEKELTISPPEEIEKQFMPENLKKTYERIVVKNPDISFNEIGGNEEAIAELKRLCSFAKNEDIVKKWGAKLPKGILLYGPPGTGKTLMVKALASTVEAELLHVKLTDLKDKWVGDSEKNAQAIFDVSNWIAKHKGKKVILFFDELDAIAPDRNREFSHQTDQNVVSIMLQNIDGFGSNTDVVIIGATNAPEKIDPAFRRAGRLDRSIEIKLPDPIERKDILQRVIKKVEERAGGRKLVNTDDLDYKQIILLSEGFSGADISNAIEEGLRIKAFQEINTGNEPPILDTNDIISAMELVRPKNYTPLNIHKKLS